MTSYSTQKAIVSLAAFLVFASAPCVHAQGGGPASDSTSAGGSGSPPPTVVQLPDWINNISISGRAYLRYSGEIGDSRKGFNEFAIDRLYVIMAWQLWERARLRYTMEAGEIRANDYSLSGQSLSSKSGVTTAATKHLYFEYQNPFGAGSFIQFGLAGLPYVPYVEDLWGYRVQGNVFADRSGYLTSADLGLALGGQLGSAFGNWQLSVVNGDGWKKPESGDRKDVHLRVTLNPLAGVGGAASRLFVTGFQASGRYDDRSSGPDDRNRTALLVGYKNAGKGMLAVEQLWTSDPASAMASRYPSLAGRAGQVSDGTGYSIFGTLSPAAFGATGNATRLEFLGRLDHLDPDDAIDDNDFTRFIGGVSWRAHARMKLLATLENVTYGSAAQKTDERRILLQTEIRF